MLVATDVAYDEERGRARAAAVVFEAWGAAAAEREATRELAPIAPYEPGAFYRRELPCLLPLLEDLARVVTIDVVIIDGYVDLGASPGLGRHLARAMRTSARTPAIVGVAKTRYAGASAVEVLRGRSRQPLFVTALGMSPEDAAREVARMEGDHRIPTILRRVDRLARGG